MTQKVYGEVVVCTPLDQYVTLIRCIEPQAVPFVAQHHRHIGAKVEAEAVSAVQDPRVIQLAEGLEPFF